MLWYVLERYVHVLLGRTHLTLPPDEQQKYERYLASKKKNNNNNKVKGVSFLFVFRGGGGQMGKKMDIICT